MLDKDEQRIFYKKLGEKIREARKDNGNRKQETLAYELGLTRTSLVNIEHGNQKIQLHTLVELAKILKVQILDLIPNMEQSIKVNLDRKSETNLSKQIQSQVDDPDNVMEILRNFIKLTQQKK